MRCFALVQLDGGTAEAFAARAMADGELTWVHRCHLEHGHGGDHRCIDPTTDCLLEWDDLVPEPRILSAPSIDVEELGGPDLDVEQPPGDATPVVNGAPHPCAPELVPAGIYRTKAQALDAIAEALERICEAFTALTGDLDDGAGNGRHVFTDGDPGVRR